MQKIIPFMMKNILKIWLTKIKIPHMQKNPKLSYYKTPYISIFSRKITGFKKNK